MEILDDLGTMHADLTKVRQALLNLLSNAAKFTEGGTITLRASSPRPNPTASRIGLSWKSIRRRDRHDSPRSFPGSSARSSRPTPRPPGAMAAPGLGLTITRRFCEMMGGEITVVSEPGRGSAFTIRLPARATASASRPPVLR